MSYQWAKRAIDNLAPAPSQVFGLRPGMIRLGGGHAYPNKFPNIVEEAAAAARLDGETLQYGPLYGLNELREAIVALLRADGVQTTSENILITNGAKHGIELACRVFLEPGDAIIVSDPTYMTALSIFRGQELVPVIVPTDADGMDVAALRHMLTHMRADGTPIPKLLYEVPDFHNPTGVTLPQQRRLELLALAEEFDFLILEDDPYRNLRFDGQAVPPIQHFDRNGRVIGFGTFSKYLAPGLRVGWVNADTQIVRRMAALKTDGGSSPFSQRIVTEILASGRLPAHIEDLTLELKSHRDAMAASMRHYMPEVTFELPPGGYYIWADLNGGVDSMLVAAETEKLDVSIIPGAQCHAYPKTTSQVRLSFSYNTPSEIEVGIERLSRAVKTARAIVRPNAVTSDMRQFN